MKSLYRPTVALAGACALGLMLTGCGKNGGKKTKISADERTANAEATYVGPGEFDEYYLFYSGGHSGQVYVAGLPSMRHIVTIPVFAPYPATGYGFDVESKKLLGDYTWGDVHHPALSQTDSMYDGRWLFVNDNANNRVARVDLRDFKTKQVIGPMPNSSGSHASSFVTENTEYLFVSTRFSTPLPKGTISELENYATDYNGMITALQVNPDSGEMSMAFQILMPPFNFDLASTGKGPSSGFVFFTSYNTEMAHETLEVGASQLDRDLGAIVNWRAAAQAVADGKGTEMSGVQVLDPAKVPGIVHLIGIAKSPHGIDVDPTGKWIAAGGKLQPTATVINVEKMLKAIDAKDYEDDFRGIPVVHYSIGHLVVAGSDTKEPYGKWMVAMNKLSKGRHINVGPSQPESSQLIDISGEKMRMVAEAFTEPEPHFAQILKVDKIKPIEVYPKAESKDPNAVWDLKDGTVSREGNVVEAKVVAVRSRFSPDKIEAQVGDTVRIHVTNIEQTADMIHGYGINEHNINIVVDPGETKTIEFVAEKQGVFPFYCTNFCSALHQEMQGYMIIRPKDGAKPAAAAAPAPAPAPAAVPEAEPAPAPAQEEQPDAATEPTVETEEMGDIPAVPATADPALDVTEEP